MCSWEKIRHERRSWAVDRGRYPDVSKDRTQDVSRRNCLYGQRRELRNVTLDGHACDRGHSVFVFQGGQGWSRILKLEQSVHGPLGLLDSYQGA